MATLHLASTSPRRVHLLTEAGIAFRLTEPGPEPVGEGTPDQLARLRARSKAVGAAAREGLVLGADTVVAIGDREFGKPETTAEAAAMLEALAGREHLVHTALCIVDRRRGTMREALATARVQCQVADPAAIDRYVASGAWQGKAGGYGIQDPGCTFMALVEGELDTVVGLPLTALRGLLQELGVAEAR